MGEKGSGGLAKRKEKGLVKEREEKGGSRREWDKWEGGKDVSGRMGVEEERLEKGKS